MDLKPVSVKKEREISQQNADLTAFVRVADVDGIRSRRWRAASSHALIGGLLEPLNGPSCSVPGGQREKLAESRASGRSKNRGWNCP